MTTGIEDQILVALSTGRKIEAIRLTMDAYDISLAEAKQFVDELEGSNTNQVAEIISSKRTQKKSRNQQETISADGKKIVFHDSYPSTTVPELMFKRKFLTFLFGLLLLIGFLFPGFWHLSLFAFKTLCLVMIFTAVVRFFSGAITGRILIAALLINIATIGLLATMLVYPNGMTATLSPTTWVLSIVYCVFQFVVVKIFGHPLLSEWKKYMRNSLRRYVS